jgi:hypothetical protein
MENNHPPPTYQEIHYHMVFDVKIEDFCRKFTFVAGGHKTDTPHAMTYAIFVSRESVRVALTLSALNDLDVNMADIENAYLTAPITEKIWIVLGPDNDVHLIRSRKVPLVIFNHEVINIMSPIGSLILFTSTLLLGFDILY